MTVIRRVVWLDICVPATKASHAVGTISSLHLLGRSCLVANAKGQRYGQSATWARMTVYTDGQTDMIIKSAKVESG